MPRVRYIHPLDAVKFDLHHNFPNFPIHAPLVDMKRKFNNEKALCVRTGHHIFDVSTQPDIYRQAK